MTIVECVCANPSECAAAKKCLTGPHSTTHVFAALDEVEALMRERRDAGLLLATGEAAAIFRKHADEARADLPIGESATQNTTGGQSGENT